MKHHKRLENEREKKIQKSFDYFDLEHEIKKQENLRLRNLRAKKIDQENDQKGRVSTFLDHATHFKGKHDTEYLYRIPLKPTQTKG